MTEEALKQEYFEWIYSICLAEEPPRKKPTYRRLLEYLHSVQFSYILGLDGNRADDGENLRYRFGADNGYHDGYIAEYLDNFPCSVLEMMIALAIRCEESIMANPDIGDRTGRWFWDMIVSLGLDDMYDSAFRIGVVRDKVDKFLSRKYARNGEGGLFTVQNKKQYDLTTIDIWYQAMWYLDEQFEKWGE